MTDLVKRLRKNVMCGDAVIEEAADRIEHLEDRCANLLVGNGILNIHIEKLEAALEDMAQYISKADWIQLTPETHQVWDLGEIDD
jgi:hypothetical protein